VAGVAVAWSLGLFEDETLTVPTVIGMSSDEASETIVGAGLVVGEVTTEFSDTISEDKVMDQDPDGGSSAEPSATVDLVVSGGQELVEVPMLVGLPESEALAAIRNAELVLETIQREHSAEIDEGLVMRQTPETSATVAPGTPVTIVVSAGTELVKVPDVANKSRTEAQGILQDAGLAVTFVEEFSDTVAKDVVISQSPSAGVSIEVGSAVTVTVSKGEDLVEVPDVFEFLEADAIDDITDRGLVPDIVYVDSPDDGLVLEQWPVAGASVARGSTVTITVGRTPSP
jgi:serine/threonine-protein kinase